jgi:hypothetical protein
METIRELWKSGGTNCRRISGSRFGYQFKYAFKGVFQDDDSGLALPQWFLDYYKEGTDGSKPQSFARVRFWQTSKGFYTGITPQQSKHKEPLTSINVRTAREILESRRDSVVVIARDRSGRYVKSLMIRIHGGFPAFFRHHDWAAEHKRSFALSSRSFLVDSQTAHTTTNQTDIWKLKQIQQENSLTLRKASLIRRSLQTLHRC